MSSARVYVGNLARRTSPRDLEDMFDRYGRVRRLDMKDGFAFIEFDDPRDASDAVRDLDGRSMDGARLRVEISRNRHARGDRCFVCGSDGHWAANCPQGSGVRDASSGLCFKCGEGGHIARDCREGGDSRGRRGRSYSRSPPRRSRRDRSYSRDRSRSRSPARRSRSRSRN